MKIRNKKLIIRNKEVIDNKKFDPENILVKLAYMFPDERHQNLENMLSKGSERF